MIRQTIAKFRADYKVKSMKTTHLFALILILFASMRASQAQITVFEYSKKEMAHNLSELKKRNLIFVIRDSEIEQIPKYETALRNGWTLSEVEVVTSDELLYYEDSENYTFVTLDARAAVAGKADMSTAVLTMMFKDSVTKKGPTNIKLAEIFMYADYKYFNTTYKDIITKEDSVIQIHNYLPGFLQLYFQYIQKNLETGTSVKHFQKTETLNSNKTALFKNVLYIPDYCLKKFKLIDPRANEYYEESEFRDKYFGKLTFVDSDSLSDLILRKEINFVLIYNMHYTQSFVNIFNVQTGEMVHKNVYTGDYDLAPVRLKEI